MTDDHTDITDITDSPVDYLAYTDIVEDPRAVQCSRCGFYFIPAHPSYDTCELCHIIRDDQIEAYNTRLLELQRQILEKDYLTIETCDTCRMPYVTTVSKGRKVFKCKDCKRSKGKR